MNLLAISSDKFDFREMHDTEVKCGLILDAEHIFKATFSEENYFSSKNDTTCAIHNISVVVPSNNVLPAKVGCCYF